MKILNSVIARNAIMLMTMQLFNMIAPFIVLPYLSRIFGVDDYGIYLIAMSCCAILLIFTDFGFSLSATYEISKNREIKHKVESIFSSIFFAKLILIFILSIVSFFYTSYYSEQISSILVFLIFINVAVQSFIPTWFFQGIERVKHVMIYNVASRLVFVISVLLIIDNSSKVEDVFLIYFLSNVISLFLSIKTMYQIGYKIRKVSLKSALSSLTKSFPFFISRAMVATYTTANTLIVGSLSTTSQAAYYGSSEKIYLASQTVSSSLVQALFPNVSRSGDYKLIFKLVGVICGVMLFLLPLPIYFSGEIMQFVFGEEYYGAGSIMSVFSVVSVINFAGANFGYPAFGAINRVHLANYTIFIGVFTQALLLGALYLNDAINAQNVVWSLLFSELAVMISRLIILTFILRRRNA
ncbi:oligosaccharide flippase family protein [Vibrio alginolyticus]|uniref:oligosaccharide flippase family protein n=1 Tax=Vibrio alginolyticus TaxID=663 RepID=UPI001BD20A73|nr:oligosaccharide flippase family protein [Vibrio alginolyticus]MBS9898251.1 oligosaccharide flippase family protein [Vibrio alginolyticus]